MTSRRERDSGYQAVSGDGPTAAGHFDDNDMAKAVHMGSQSMAAGFPFVAVAARIRAQASYAGLVVLILAGCGMALLLIHESQLWRSTITDESRAWRELMMASGGNVGGVMHNESSSWQHLVRGIEHDLGFGIHATQDLPRKLLLH